MSGGCGQLYGVGSLRNNPTAYQCLPSRTSPCWSMGKVEQPDRCQMIKHPRSSDHHRKESWPCYPTALLWDNYRHCPSAEAEGGYKVFLLICRSDNVGILHWRLTMSISNRYRHFVFLWLHCRGIEHSLRCSFTDSIGSLGDSTDGQHLNGLFLGDTFFQPLLISSVIKQVLWLYVSGNNRVNFSRKKTKFTLILVLNVLDHGL